MNDDWVSASDALDRLEARLGGRAVAKETLADLLRDGKLAARAARIWYCDEKDVEWAWEGKDEPCGDWRTNENIDQENWRDSVQWIEDISLWRWPESFFLVTSSKRPFERCYLDGVSFRRSEVDRLFAGGKPPTSTKSRGGRRPDLQRWERFWMEVIQIARDGNLVPGQIASQAALREDVLAGMKDSALSEDSIKEPIRRIWHRFCED